MKKILYFVLPLFLFSCEPGSDYNYIVINNCEDAIKVSYSIYPDKESIAIIESDSKCLIFEKATTHSSIEKERIVNWFKQITITKGEDTSKVNYLDKNLWRMEKISKNEANFYLSINPEDFISE